MSKNKKNRHNNLTLPNLNQNKSLKNDNTMFGFDKHEKANTPALVDIELENLQPFENNPFKLYSDEQLEDMTESIKNNGVMTPIIVRLINDTGEIRTSTYQILAGHNRVNASRKAGLNRIPAIIKYNLTDEEAIIYVIETNALQRSFSQLSHSEKAAIISIHYSKMFSQGKRSAIIEELYNIEMNLNIEKNDSALLVRKLDHRDIIADNYDLDRGSVARYLRINKLITDLKMRIDNNEIGLYAGVELSFLKEEEQKNINIILDQSKYKINIKNAKMLREYSQNNNLFYDTIQEILSGVIEKAKLKEKLKSVVLKPKTLKKYYSLNNMGDVEKIIERDIEFRQVTLVQTVKKYLSEDQIKNFNIEDTVIEALELYFNK